MQYSSYCDWLTSFSTMSSRTTPFLACDRIIFFLTAYYSVLCTCDIFFIHLVLDIWVATLNNAVMNMGKQISLSILDVNPLSDT